VPCRVFAPLVQASVGKGGPPLPAYVKRERRAAYRNCTVPVGSVRSCPRQFVVALARAPDPIGFPEAMSVRQSEWLADVR
jgi:hypothetical protein